MAPVPGTWAGKALLTLSLLIAPAASGAADSAYSEMPSGLVAADSIRALREGRDWCGAQRLGPGVLVETERRYGSESLETAAVLDQLAQAFVHRMFCKVDQWQKAQAVEYAERAVAIRERDGGEDLDLAGSLEILGDRLCEAASAQLPGVPPDACKRGGELRERAIAIRTRLQGEGHPDVLELKADLRLPPFSPDRGCDGLPYLKEAVAFWEDSLGTDDPRVAQSVFELVRYVNLRNCGGNEAEQHLARVVSILEKSPRKHARLLARALQSWALMKGGRGQYAEAEKMHRRAIGLIEQSYGPNSPVLFSYLNNLANSQEYGGDYEAALPLRERNLSIARSTRAIPPRYEASQLGGLAGCYWGLGDANQYFRLMEDCLRTYKQAIPRYHSQFAVEYGILASSQLVMGDFEAARNSLDSVRHVLSLAGEFFPRQIIEGGTDGLEGRLLHLTGRHEEALVFLERAAANRALALPYGGIWLAHVLGYLGDTQLALRDYESADSSYTGALAIWEKNGPSHPEATPVLCGLGDLHLARGEYDEALPRFEGAMANAATNERSEHSQMARSQVGLAEARAGLGDYEGALAAALEAERISTEYVRLIVRGQSERQALRYAQVRSSGLDLALTIAARNLAGKATQRTLNALVSSRAQVFDELAARHRAAAASAASDPELARLHEDLRVASDRLANLMVRAPGGLGSNPQAAAHHRGQLQTARDAKERAERQLAEKSAPYRDVLAHERANLDDVRKALAPGDALVAFVRYADGLPADEGHDAYAAFIMRHDAQPEIVALGSAERIDGIANEWRSAIHPDSLYMSRAMQLRQAAWDPTASSLAGSERVFIVPDGSLNLVSFATLPDEDGNYLLETGPVLHHLVAERDLAGTRSTAAQAKGLLTFGGPAYDERSLFAALGDSPRESGSGSIRPATSVPRIVAMAAAGKHRRSGCRQFSEKKFGSLSGTLQESKEIAQLWRNEARSSVTQLQGRRATEAAFKEQAPRHRMLHIATHGFFLGGECQSALARTRGTGELTFGDPAAPSAAAGENPLLLSGLALAGANHREHAGPEEDDGILTAGEIASLNLSGVEWAVLSACETGVGEVQAGEGVFGLRRAFQVAGARTLIMSLWDVEDEATRAWMVELYRARLEQGLDTAESVRAASLKVLNDRRANGESTHPFYWGAFVAAGRWE